MDVKFVAAKLGASPSLAAAMAEAANRFGVVMTDHWLAQIYVESAGFKRVRENLNYSAARLLEVFPGRNGLKTIEQANAIRAKGYEGIGEAIYGMPWGVRMLGNTHPGDGGRFVGRGLKQLTGRANYTRYSMAMYGDLRVVNDPTMLERLPDAAMSAGWYWKAKNIDAAGDNINRITKLVNGGLNGLEARKDALRRVRAVG